ncbi:hypothetical protein QYE76_021812 [Lolium multiflorum]|uniref:Stigma-specific Stig1 family protein n=1 Tax=Lolium multiflorum TaxID=4521 RepID=A0AAD8VT85_LOLMU|nr:hypothetical protein QYE76_021812 [Lolium multiflorum]
MAHGAAGPTSFLSRGWSSSVFLVVVLAVSAAACLRIAAAHAGRANPRPTEGGGRFLASVIVSRRMEGDACRAGGSGECGAAPGGRLKCCGGACTDVLASRSNCGGCGARCPFGQLCCGGRCVDVVYDGENCGACRRPARLLYRPWNVRR